MDQQTNTDLGQAEEEILNPTVSDEALEAAAGTERGVGTPSVRLTSPICCPALLPTRGIAADGV